MKTTLMAFGLAAVFLLGTACFGLFTPDRDEPAPAGDVACADLEGQAKADCEARQRR
jgi:hypothetical protein